MIEPNLSRYQNNEFDPGRTVFVRIAWYLISAIFFESSFVPISSVKRMILRCFGARIGIGVVIKPNVRIKFPWRLWIGDHSWIGQSVWIDNLAEVTIEENVCISQWTYLCTGSHDHQKETFDLITRPIIVKKGSWLCAKSIILPGVVVEAGSIVGAGSVVTKNTRKHTFISGVPAQEITASH